MYMKDKLKHTVTVLCAALAGLCNSLIGAGGGIILSLALSKLLSDRFEDKRNIYVSSQAAMIPSCALSCWIYHINGKLDITGSLLLAVPAAIGGIVGGLVLTKIKVDWVKAIFALLVIFSGVRMIMS